MSYFGGRVGAGCHLFTTFSGENHGQEEKEEEGRAQEDRKPAKKKKRATKRKKRVTKKKKRATKKKKRATKKKRRPAKKKKRATKRKKKVAKKRKKAKRVVKRRKKKAVKKKKRKKRKPNLAFMRPVQPDAKLAAVVGSKPLPRTELTKKLWKYIKRHKLQDKRNRRMINADAKMKPVFNGKAQVSMFEMTKLVNKHVK
jgi:chromatin remodeling complex protein RSC6